MEKLNLLIIDDKIENVISLTALLEEIDNLNILSTTDPNEALRICWKENISIALVDVQMPNINGFEFVSMLKGNPKTNHIIAIMVTAISKEDKYLLQGLNSGAVDYLYKPLNTAITIAKVRSFMQQVFTQQEIQAKNIQLEESKIELIQAKEESELARKSKELFLANMSHEIRTPINGIIGISQMLKNSHVSEEQTDWIQRLESASQDLLTIINDILDISKIDSGMMKIENDTFSLHDLSDELYNLFYHKAQHKKLNFSIKIDEHISSYIISDLIRLKQILINFIANSIKFTAQGSVSLTIELLAKNNVKSHLKFTVKDTGIGIPTESLTKIFLAFEQAEEGITRKFGGTGLGLAIVQKLANLFGGKVVAKSDYGKGSEFSFECWFDTTDQFEKTAPKKALYSELPKFENLKVLIAEDNELNSFMLTNILKTWNCEVAIACNGKIALDYLKKEYFDLVMMDTHMPILSGIEAIKQIRSLSDPAIRDIAIITISASVMLSEQQEALEIGADQVIGKPFDPLQLYAMIQKVLFDKKGIKPLTIDN
ncbi:response regulator [Sphingobacteriaceae bacterium WQ 2009]|uniref:histidine kinase n=1 Tax=Rhinopithecimicrobium faecis TaxID=2820698 RepID=A0A8T4H9X1_9SPHI|nr:response regulator [Sphingobacteriaceae bacterium WQ 2009]